MISTRPSLQALITDLYANKSDDVESDQEDEQQDEKEEQSPNIEKFINELTVKTRTEKILSTAITGNFILYPFLFANFMPIFWKIQVRLFHEEETNLYYRCHYLPEIRRAISYDGATLRAEGAGLTTTSVGLGALIGLLAALYQLTDFMLRKKRIHNNIDLLEAVDYFISSLALQNREHEIKLRRFLLNAPVPKLKKLLANNINNFGIDEDVIKEIQQTKSNWQAFVDDLAWYREELNTNYFLPIVGLSTIPAFIVTYMAALQFYDKSDCPTFPLFSYITDSCDVTEQYENLSLLTYFWDILSVTGLSVYCVGLVARAVTAIKPLSKFRPWFYENIHQKYVTVHPDKWVYKKLAWAFSSYIFAPFILTYAFIEAITLANKYSESAGCPSFFGLLHSIYTNDAGSDYHCSSAEKSMGIAGFLGDFEIVKVDLMFFTLMCLSYLFAAIMEKCFYKNPDEMDEIDIEARNNHLVSAKKMLAKTDHISKRSWDFAIMGCIVIAIIQFVPIKNFADSILHNDLEVYKKINVTIPNNMSLPEIYFTYAQEICPYDNLTNIIKQYINLTQYNLTQLLNQTMPIKIVGNDTVAVTNAKACTDYDIAGVYFYNIAGIDTGCDPLLETRSIGGFIGPYWLGISIISGGIYVLATSAQLLKIGIGLVKKHFFTEPEHTTDIPYQHLSTHDDDVKLSVTGTNGFFHRPPKIEMARSNSVQLRRSL